MVRQLVHLETTNDVRAAIHTREANQELVEGEEDRADRG
jgi:hypothetical protein